MKGLFDRSNKRSNTTPRIRERYVVEMLFANGTVLQKDFTYGQWEAACGWYNEWVEVFPSGILWMDVIKTR